MGGKNKINEEVLQMTGWHDEGADDDDDRSEKQMTWVSMCIVVGGGTVALSLDGGEVRGRHRMEIIMY